MRRTNVFPTGFYCDCVPLEHQQDNPNLHGFSEQRPEEAKSISKRANSGFVELFYEKFLRRISRYLWRLAVYCQSRMIFAFHFRIGGCFLQICWL